MNFKRIGRILVCLLLVCALLINISPIKAKADVVSGGLVAAGATGAVVSVPVAIAIGATLIALGIIADAASQNPYALQKLASDVGDALAAAGTYVKDGMVEMYRFITDTGEAVYYAAADFMEAVRSTVYETDCGVFSDESAFVAQYGSSVAQRLQGLRDEGYSNIFAFVTSSGSVKLFYDMHPSCPGPRLASNGHVNCYCDYGYTGYFDYVGCSYVDPSKYVSTFRFSLSDGKYYSITNDLTVENFLTVPIDGTSARTWSEAYANRGLYIASGGNQGAPDDGAEGNDGWKFLLPLAFLAGADLWAMSQADQWTGSTPPEFGDYTTEEELTITPAPEVDGYQAIEIAPVTNPNPDPDTGTDPGTGSDPDSGGDSSDSTLWQRLYQWLLEIKTSINELPNKFDEHFENLNNNIQEAPNKFETWIQNVQTSVDAVAESILGTADEINAAISNLPNAFSAHVQNILSAIAAVPQAIIAGIQTVLQNLFVPDPDYFSNKIRSLVDKFGYLEPIISLGDTFKVYLTGVNPTPPVIWIDLGASAWYPLGGRVKFIDLTWYAQYKPTVDGIIGAFLWLWFLWRLLQAAPGIIQGSSGIFGNPDPHPDKSFNVPNWPTGQRLLQSGSFYHFRGSGDKHKFNE